MNEKVERRIIQKSPNVRAIQNNLQNNSISAHSIKDDNFFPENLYKNQKQVLLPFRTSQLNNIAPTIACLLIPGQSIPPLRIKSSSPPASFSTHRKYHSSHIEMPSNKAIPAIQSERPNPGKARTGIKQLNCKSNRFFTQKMHERIPRLQKKHWNSFHQNKIKNNIIISHNLKKIKLRSLKQNENIASKSQGVLTLNMQCIPFSIWNRNTKTLLVKSEKQSPVKRKEENVKQEQYDQQNEDKLKRLQIISRQNNLRKKILMNVLQGNPYASQAKRQFICYFPHTDYDLALKEYVKRHEELEGRTRFLSLSRNNEEERLEKTEHIVFKRESCLNFTQFNRQKYDIKMSRADLIKTILEKKATDYITGQFAKQMRGKIEKLIVQAIKQQSQSSNSSKSLPIRKSKAKQCFKSMMKMINIASQSKEMIPFHQKKKDLSRLSRIFPIQSQRRDSELKIFSDLIEGLQQNSMHPTIRNSIKTESLIEQVSSDQAQAEDSIQTADKVQNKAKRNNPLKKQKIYNNSNTSIKSRVKKQNKEESNKPKAPAFKSPSKEITNTSASIFKRQAISKKADLHVIEQKQQKGKSNELKKVNKQEMKKRIEKTAKQQKIIQFSNTPKKYKQISEKQQDMYLNLRTNTENMTINSQIKQHIIPTFIEITEPSQTLARIPSNYSKTAQIETKLTVIEMVKQFSEIQTIQQIFWQPFWQRINMALRIVRWASEEFYQKLMSQNIYFINGEWIQFNILNSPHSQQQTYAIGLHFLCNQQLNISIPMITLQMMLKIMTGQRIILFKNKLKVQDEVSYHCSKGHLIYLLPKKYNYQLTMQPNHPSFLQLNKTTSFDKIIGQYQLISINNRIKHKNIFRNHLQTSVSDQQTRTIYLNTSLSTVGTITVYFPFFKSDFYVQLLMQKKIIDKLTGQTVFKQIGRVRQKVKYDNIYFQFTIKGQYELKITVENDNLCNFKTCSQSNHEISLNTR